MKSTRRRGRRDPRRQPLRVLRLGEEIALTHHEWWDGNGYPRRLRGDESR